MNIIKTIAFVCLIVAVSNALEEYYTTPQAEEACGLFEASLHDNHRREYTHLKHDKVTKDRRWPWQVTVNSRGLFQCNGILVKLQWVLVPASCIEKETSLRVIVKGKLMDTDLKILHEDYRPMQVNQMDGDIGLIRLKEKIVPSDMPDKEVTPVCLPLSRNQFTQTTECAVTHMSGDIPIPISYDSATKKLPLGACHNSTMEKPEDGLCVSMLREVKETCEKRTILYFVCKSIGAWHLYGVNKGCNKLDDNKVTANGYFVNILNYKDWINKYTRVDINVKDSKHQ